jgi:hypothetical protein
MGKGVDNGAQNSQVYYDSGKGQYYTMAQPKTPTSPFQQFFSQSGIPGKGGTDGRTYIGSSLDQNHGSVNS